MVDRPAGTVTFLLTDIEGSTRLWEADPAVMRVALAAHDQVLRSAVDAAGGWLFKHTGDGVCAAFASAPDAVAAAVDAQRRLELPVRMGLATGTAEWRDDDYFGPVVNRAARVMAAGHGGQILLGAATAGLVDPVDLVDLGPHRLRDLSGTEHLFQVCADGLLRAFPAVRTLDAAPGNLPVQTTSFVGRNAEVAQVAALIGQHRLVTLTGVGGVGKTRLALQVAAGLSGTFPDGVWLVELATTGDPAAVADVVATVLDITARTGRPAIDSLVEALSGRRLLIVLDNCEHVLGVAAELVEVLLMGAKAVTVIATSREGLRVRGEHLWVVPSLGVDGDAAEAVELFFERAREVDASFSVDDAGDAQAVANICRRLDGIALAIELAAARMVSMSPQEVEARLSDRFRLLAGGRRGVERHQTLRQAVAWSYDLLVDHERMVLGRCSVFAGGFDLAAATHVCENLDEYLVLDVLDSLVRKSLVAAQRSAGHTRYDLWETIRQFAEEQLAATADIAEVRNRHARYFAAQAVAHFDIWDGPRQRVALDWVDAEFANLRAGFRWAADRYDLVTATTIAAHTSMLAVLLQRYESVGWAEEILDAATAADVRQLPRLYTAASLACLSGGDETAIGYAQTAVALDADPRYSGFPPGWSRYWEAPAQLFTAGRVERCLEICNDLAAIPGAPRICGLTLSMWVLTALGRAEEARTMADETVAAARAYGNPQYIALALAIGYGRAFAQTDPYRALDACREALALCREHRSVYGEAYVAYDAAGLEAVYGDRQKALELFDFAIDACHRAGDHTNLALALASLAVFLDRLQKPSAAARIYGASTRSESIIGVVGLSETVERLRSVLGYEVFDDCVAEGAGLDRGDAVAYARDQIRRARWSTESAT